MCACQPYIESATVHSDYVDELISRNDGFWRAPENDSTMKLRPEKLW